MTRINKILKETRALLSTAPQKGIYFYFDGLIKHLQISYPDAKVPFVEIVYSLNKLCETFIYGEDNYVVYDQYLGQSFNKFNRLIYYEDTQEVRAYLCKLLAEEYYLINDIENSVPFLFSYQVNAKAKVQDLPKDFLVKKSELIVVQESFVLFHELAHNLISTAVELTSKGKVFLEKNEEAKLIMKIFHDLNKEKGEVNFAHFYEELTADLIAMELTYTYFSTLNKFNTTSIIEGISLSFLYLRTLIDIKQKASGRYGTSENTFHLFTKLRYNLLRIYYTSSMIFVEDRKNSPLLIELYEKWEKKIDMEVVLFLNDEYRYKLNAILKQGRIDITRSHLEKDLGL